MKEKFTLDKKLKAYAALAGSLLASSGAASAQIVYHDIVPDDTLFAGDSLHLDLNNDGQYDFLLTLAKTTYSGSNGSFRDKIINENSNSNGAVNAYPGFPGYYYPFAMYPNDTINAKNSWVIPKTYNAYFLIAYTSSSGTYFGNWNGVHDRYAGLRLKTDTFHYGWLRMDIPQGGSYMIVKDYAYNETPNEEILAGAMFTGIHELNNRNVPKIFVADKTLFIENLSEPGEINLRVLNMLGQEIITQKISGPSSKINLNPFPPGVYVVSIIENGKRFSKKILVQ